MKFDVGVALDLKEPKIKQAPNDTSLDPLEAQNALTSVINYDGMLVGDRIIVRWTGAPGTPAAGSHTTEPWPVTTVGPQEIPLAVSVLAFNLAKSITLDYTVTRGTQNPKESRIRALAVSPIAQSDLPGPLIVQASEQGEGPELDVSQLTTNATLRANSYPHIALKQYVWLKAKGTLKGGGNYSKTFWQPPGSQTNATWIDQGFYTHTFPLPDLQSLEDGRDLELEFKAGFGGSQVETEAVTFALRTYRIKAYENVVPTLDSVKGSPSGDEIPHGGLTVETAVTLSGVAAKGQKVEIFDGTVSKDQATAHATTGVWTLLVSALAVAAHSFTVKALYGSGAVSAARTLTVTAATAPTLTSVKGSPSGDEIPHGGLTVETAVTLSGVAAKGQKVEIFDGTVSKDQATAHATTGVWTLLVSALAVAAHSFTAMARYGSGEVSAARTFTVTPALEIDTTPMRLDGAHLYPPPPPTRPEYFQPIEKAAYIPPGAHQTRQARGGSPPFEYSSSKPTVASVDPATGHVISKGNGIAMISVRDTKGNTVSYQVTCENVYDLVVSDERRLPYDQAVALLSSLGAQLFTVDGTPLQKQIYQALLFGIQQPKGNSYIWATTFIPLNNYYLTHALQIPIHPTHPGWSQQKSTADRSAYPMGYKSRIG
ncbi:hypothetical protein [Pseudomonas moraviensis]